MEKTTFIFKWHTGKIEIPCVSVLHDYTAADVKKLIATATENGDEVKAEIVKYATVCMDILNPNNKKDKKQIDKLQSILNACGGVKMTSRDRALQRIVKACERQDLAGVITFEGKHYVTDGFHMIRTAETMNGIKEAKNQHGYAPWNCFKADHISACTVKLALPDVNELKKDIKVLKSIASRADSFGRLHVVRHGRTPTIIYDFGYNMPAVDAEKLVNVMEALPGCIAYNEPNCKSKTLYFTDGDNEGLLCPVRKSCEYEEIPAIDEAENVVITEEIASAPVEATATTNNEEPVIEYKNGCTTVITKCGPGITSFAMSFDGPKKIKEMETATENATETTAATAGTERTEYTEGTETRGNAGNDTHDATETAQSATDAKNVTVAVYDARMLYKALCLVQRRKRKRVYAMQAGCGGSIAYGPPDGTESTVLHLLHGPPVIPGTLCNARSLIIPNTS